MASSITGITLGTNYGDRLKIYIFTSNTFASVDVTYTVGSGSSFNGTYSQLAYSNYDVDLGAFAVWTEVQDNYQDYTGVITASLSGESDSFIVNYVVGKTLDALNTPQGASLTMQPCESGMVRIWGGLENRNPLHFGGQSYTEGLKARFKQIYPTVGSLIEPYKVVITTDTNQSGSPSVYTDSSSGNLPLDGSKAVIFDLGLYPAGENLTFRAIGSGGVATGDYIELSTIPTCQVEGTNGVGTDIKQGQISYYSIPKSTLYYDCEDIGLRISSIPENSTISVGATSYTVGDTIPITELSLFNNSEWNGIFETTSSNPQTAIGNSGASFYWVSSCGESELVPVLRAVSLAAENSVAYPVLTEFSLCDKVCSYQSELTGTSPHNGDVFIMKHPTGINDSPVAVAVAVDGVWTARSLNFVSGQKYVAYMVRYDGVSPVGEPTINPIEQQSCDKICVEHGTFKGVVSGINNGFVRVLPIPLQDISPSIALGVIENGVFDIKSDKLLEDTEYILYAVNLEQIP